MSDNVEEFLELFGEVNDHIDRQKQINGKLGRYNSTSKEWVFDVPGKPGFWWVRPDYGGDPIAAFNKAAPRKPDLSVIVEPDINTGRLCIIDVNVEAAIAYNPQNPPVPVPPVSVAPGSGREQYTPASMLSDGLVFARTGMIIGINAFAAEYNLTQQYYTPLDTDLTSYIPAVGTQCFALVGVDPTDGSVTVLTTTPISTAVPLLEAALSALSFGNNIPLTAVVLTGGMTALSFPTNFVDRRTWITGQWFSYPLSVQFGGSAADLSTTGGTHKIVFQETLGGAFTVRVLASGDVPSGAGSPLTTKGDLYTYSTLNTRQAVGSDYATLLASSGQTSGLLWSSASTSALLLPVGTTGQEPSNAVGLVRYNSTTGRYEFSTASTWINHVRLSGDTMTGTLEIDVPTTTSDGLILKTTDNNTTDVLLRAKNSIGTTIATLTAGGQITVTPTASNYGILGVSNVNQGVAGFSFQNTNSGANAYIVSSVLNNTGNGTFWTIYSSNSGAPYPSGAVIECNTGGGINIDASSSSALIANSVRLYTGGTVAANMRARIRGDDGTVEMQNTTANTSNVINNLVIGQNTSGTVANGLGVALLLTIQDSTTANQSGSRIRSYWNDKTHASRKAYAVWSAYDTTERDVVGIGTNGSNPLLGFFTVATTPVAQQASSVALDTVLSNFGLRASGVAALGLLGTYNSDAVVGNGLASIVGSVSLTGQTATIAATNIFTPPSNGMYEALIYLEDTTASVSGGTVLASVVYTDDNGSQTQSTSTIVLSTTGFTSSVFTFFAKTSAAIQYSTTVSGVIVGSPQYALRAIIKRLS